MALRLVIVVTALALFGGAAQAQMWRQGESRAPVCLLDCAAPPLASMAAEPPAALFTPRLALGESAPAASGVSLGAPFGMETTLRLSAGESLIARDRSGYGLGAELSFLGVEVGGRYLLSEGFGGDGVALAGSYALGDLTLGGGVTLPLEAGAEGATGSLEARYRLVPGVTLGGSVSLSETRPAAAPSPEGDLSAGVSLRLEF